MKWFKEKYKEGAVVKAIKFAWFPVRISSRDVNTDLEEETWIWWEKYVAEYKREWREDSQTHGYFWILQRRILYVDGLALTEDQGPL